MTTRIAHALSSDIRVPISEKLRGWEGLMGLSFRPVPKSLTWANITPLASPRYRAAAFNIQNQLWLVGGLDGSGNVAGINVFNQATGGWSTIPNPFTSREQEFTINNGTIYAIGGVQSCQSYITRFETYTPITGALKQRPDLLAACWMPGVASTPDGKIYVMGGCSPPSTTGGPPSSILNTVQIYDPVANSWRLGKPMPGPRYQFSAVTVPNGRIYLIGGTDGNSELHRVDVYDSNSDLWLPPAAPMPTARRCLSSVLPTDNKIYAIGGLADIASLTTVEIFDPGSNTWLSGTPLANGRWFLAAGALDKKIYACGGFMRVGDYQDGNPNVFSLSSVEVGTIL